MNKQRKTVIKKIINGYYDKNPSSFIKAYESIFNWMISRYRSDTLKVNIYSYNFTLIWNTDKLTLEPNLENDTFIVQTNKKVLPRYGCTIMSWIKELHKCSKILEIYFVKGIDEIIMEYVIT